VPASVRAALALAISLGLWPALALAEPESLEQARRLYLAARFDDAERAFLDLLADPSATRADVTQAYRHLAVIRLARGRRAAAEEAALRAASLDPTVQAPEGASGSVRALFEDVRARVPASGLAARLRAPIDPVAGAPAEVEIEVDGDPGQLASAAIISCGGAQVRIPLPRGPAGSARANAAVGMGAASGPGECTAQVTTASGAVVAEAAVAFTARPMAPVAEARHPATAMEPADGRPHESSAALRWLWVTVGATALVLGTYVVNDFVIYGSNRSGDVAVTPE